MEHAVEYGYLHLQYADNQHNSTTIPKGGGFLSCIKIERIATNQHLHQKHYKKNNYL